MSDLKVGQLVISKAGHDINKKFIVTCIINKQYVYISDGGLRKVEKPKKKKIKHLEKLEYISEEIRQNIENGKKITNSDIRYAIKSQDRYLEQEV